MSKKNSRLRILWADLGPGWVTFASKREWEGTSLDKRASLLLLLLLLLFIESNIFILIRLNSCSFTVFSLSLISALDTPFLKRRFRKVEKKPLRIVASDNLLDKNLFLILLDSLYLYLYLYSLFIHMPRHSRAVLVF